MSEKPTYEELEKRIQELEHVDLARKKAEAELGQLFSMSLDMICIADIKTSTFIKINPAFTEILGYSEKELLQRPFLDFIHPDDLDETRNVLKQKLQMGKKVINFENRYRCKDDSYRWFSWVSRPDTEKGFTYAIARDITDRKENEKALKKSKSLLDATGRMARVGGWELDADTMAVTWTEETYRIHEIPLYQKPPLQEAINFFHPEDRPKLERAIQRALDHAEPYDMENRFITAKGNHIWTRTKCQPEIADGKVVKLRGTFQDITPLKQAEEQIRQTENKLRSVLDATPFPIAIVDTEDDKIIYWSRSAQKLFGHTAPTAAEWYEIAYPDRDYRQDVIERWKPFLEDAQKSGKSVNTGEYKICCKDGSIRICELHAKFLADSLIVTFNDITDRKQVEKSLLKSEMQFRQVFENVGVGIAIYKPSDDGSDFIFKDINPAGAKIGQKPRTEHIGKSVLDVYPGVKDLGLFAVFQEVWQTGVLKHHHTTQYKDEKVAFWVDNYVSKLPLGDIMAVYEDVTKQKQAEETLKNVNLTLETRVAQRTAELAEANKELEDFVYSVSHDLRAPLRSISGFAQIIDRRHKTSLNEEGQHYFDNIIKASQQMGDLIDDLLRFSRMGRKSFKPEPVALDEVLKSAVKTLLDQIKATTAKVNFPEHLPVVQGDFALSTHVFINLIENAIKYQKANEAPVVDVGIEVEDQHVVVSVADNGIGIESEYHDKIFKMFQRLHSQADYPGTGIGLAAVKKALQMMGGEVFVESELGKGSVFKVRLLKATAA